MREPAVRVTTTIRAAGQATWSGAAYAVEVYDVETEAWDRAGDSARRHATYHLSWRRVDGMPPPPELRLGQRAYPTEAERSRWLKTTASDVDLREVEEPVPLVRPHPLAELVGQSLTAVEFVPGCVSLRFQPGGVDPVPAHQGPLTFLHEPLLLDGSKVLGEGERGYADGLVALVSEDLTAVDEYLDTGLDLTFSGGRRLSLPLGPWPGGWAELATYRTEIAAYVWMAGEPPFDASPPPPP